MKRIAIPFIVLFTLIGLAAPASAEIPYKLQLAYASDWNAGKTYAPAPTPAPAPVVAPTPVSTAHAFISGAPYRWQPCQTITFAIDLSTQVVKYPTDTIRSAIQTFVAQTGYRFVEVPLGTEKLTIRWSPNVGTNNAHAWSLRDGNGLRYRGYVEFHPTKYPLRATALHELGHIMGLQHVSDRQQIMGVPRDVRELGAGDKLGLQSLDNDATCWLA